MEQHSVIGERILKKRRRLQPRLRRSFDTTTSGSTVSDTPTACVGTRFRFCRA